MRGSRTFVSVWAASRLTEVDDLLLDTIATSGGRLVPHLHMPLQSGADPVLRRMRRWHTREEYRARTLEIADRLPVLGLGADVITGFPGETDEDHAATRSLIEELPFTYLHVFPFSPRDGTVAAELQREMPVPERTAGERSRDLRALVQDKGEAYQTARIGGARHSGGREGRQSFDGGLPASKCAERRKEAAPIMQQSGILRMGDSGLYIDLDSPNSTQTSET